jgi:6,7-dimethyl-8-ribityllumazine synthase
MAIKRDGQWIIVGVSAYEASFILKSRKREVIYHDIAVLGAVINGEEYKNYAK